MGAKLVYCIGKTKFLLAISLLLLFLWKFKVFEAGSQNKTILA